MTLIAALQCKDGILIGSDSKLSIGTNSALPVSKLNVLDGYSKIWGASYNDDSAYLTFQKEIDKFPETANDKYIFGQSLSDEKSKLFTELSKKMGKIKKCIRLGKELHLVFCEVFHKKPYILPPSLITYNSVSEHPYCNIGKISGLYLIGYPDAYSIVEGIINDVGKTITDTSYEEMSPILCKALFYAIRNFDTILQGPIIIHQINSDGIIIKVPKEQIDSWLELIRPSDKFAQAKPSYSRQLKSQPPTRLILTRKDKLLTKSNTLMSRGKWEKASEVLDKLLELTRKEFKSIWWDKGIALGNSGQLQNALDCFKEVIKLDSKDINAWFTKGWALGNLGRWEEALDAFEQALKINPKYKEARNNKGVALGKLGRYKNALAAFDEALKIDPKYTKALYNTGVALGNLGRQEGAEALAALKEALKIDPKDEKVKAVIVKLKKQIKS